VVDIDYEMLTRPELIQRLIAEQEARRALEANSDQTAEHSRLLHELHVHQLELEAQNQSLREAHGLVEESRSRYADLYDFAPIGYLTLDGSGVVREINLTGASMLGKERAYLVGKPLFALVRLDEPEALNRHIRKTLEGVIPVMSELTFSTARGSMGVEFVSVAVQNARGEPTACRTAMIDVTSRLVAERQASTARSSERAMHARLVRMDRAMAAVTAALANLSPSDMQDFLQVIVDQSRLVVEAEFAALGIGGERGGEFEHFTVSDPASEQPVTGRKPRAVGLLGAVIDAGRPLRLRDFDQAMPGLHEPPFPAIRSFLGVPIEYQGEHRGTLCLVNKSGAGEFSEDDQSLLERLAERVGMAIEVARWRQIEAREHFRSAFLAKAGPLLAESIDYGATLEKIARLVVPAMADLSAIDLLEADGSVRKVVVHHRDPHKQAKFAQLVGVTPAERLPEEVRAAIATAEPQRRELTPEFLSNGLADGAYREILRQLGARCTIVAPLLVRGRVVGLLRLAITESNRSYSDNDLSLAREIAHHASLAIESARLYRAAQTAVTARDNLLAAVSHDLRNYLSTIRMSAEVLAVELRAALGRSGKKPVDAILRSVSRMDELIESLCDATMIETGHFKVELKPEDVGEILDEALRTLEPQAQARGVRLIVEPRREALPARCDRERVLQILANLIGNALKFTEANGEVRVAAERVKDAVRISVADTGAGIPDHLIDQIFDRHWTSSRSSRGGTGLGLFIAKGIVDAHGGRIWAENRAGLGSKFSFELPDGTVSRREADGASETGAGGQFSRV
jgi:PAS domain S-box-containing protein